MVTEVKPMHPPENFTADFGDGVADGHRGQACAIAVFANCFISTIHNLNGRKLLTWILEDM